MDDKHLYTVIFIGRSGSGKGTQASLVTKYLEDNHKEVGPVLYLETGERFRDFIQGDSLASNLSKQVMNRGELQPSFLSAWMWSNELIEKVKGNEHLIIDGSPRKLNEAVMMADALKFFGRKRPTVVYLNVSFDWSKDKLLKRGRPDDASVENIDKRLAWFDAEVAPAVEFFRNNGHFNFLDVNGENPIEVVHQDIISRL